MRLCSINKDGSVFRHIPEGIDYKFLQELNSCLHGSRISETVTAPAKPGVKPDRKTDKPSRPKRRQPFNPKKPKVQPKPKAFLETFERSVHPNTQNFWDNVRTSDHPFSKHPLMAMYGREKAGKAWERNMGLLRKAFPQIEGMPDEQAQRMVPQLAMQAMQAVMRAEAPHRDALKQIALEVVNEVWGMPMELMEAEFTNQPGMDTPEHQEATPEDIERLRDQINKRITMNAMTQGAAVQNMATIHHLAEKKISTLAPDLMQFYDQFSSSAVSFYWVIDFANMADLAGQAIGTAEVDFEGEQPVVKAQAMVFPVLVQELVKGIMEVLSAHGLEDLDEHDTNVVYSQADRLEDEPWLIQIGPHLWEAFLKIVPRGHQLVDIVANLAAKDPKFIHDLLAQTIEAVHGAQDPEEQRMILSQMMEELEDHEDELEEPEDPEYDLGEAW
jgi:hypothetical protein